MQVWFYQFHENGYPTLIDRSELTILPRKGDSVCLPKATDTRHVFDIIHDLGAGDITIHLSDKQRLGLREWLN
jgi:hypothetical protein